MDRPVRILDLQHRDPARRLEAVRQISSGHISLDTIAKSAERYKGFEVLCLFIYIVVIFFGFRELMLWSQAAEERHTLLRTLTLPLVFGLGLLNGVAHWYFQRPYAVVIDAIALSPDPRSLDALIDQYYKNLGKGRAKSVCWFFEHITPKLERFTDQGVLQLDDRSQRFLSGLAARVYKSPEGGYCPPQEQRLAMAAVRALRQVGTTKHLQRLEQAFLKPPKQPVQERLLAAYTQRA